MVIKSGNRKIPPFCSLISPARKLQHVGILWDFSVFSHRFSPCFSHSTLGEIPAFFHADTATDRWMSHLETRTDSQVSPWQLDAVAISVDRLCFKSYIVPMMTMMMMTMMMMIMMMTMMMMMTMTMRMTMTMTMMMMTMMTMTVMINDDGGDDDDEEEE